MKALILKELRQPLVLMDRPELEPGPNDVVVRLKAAALNRRDFWITQGMYPGIKTPVIMGSDGAGTVVKTGSALGNFWLNRDVLINPGMDWGDSNDAQKAEFSILGMPVDGTFAEEVIVPASQLHEKPSHLDWQEAAALPLAGVTAWRAVFTQGKLKADDTVLITGIGGGVATFALQFALAAKANVWVTSSSQKKIDRAVALGAKGGFNYKEENWTQTLIKESSPPNLIIDSAGGKGYAQLLDLTAPGGRIVNYGATTGPPEKFDLFKVFWKQLRIVGTTMGSPDDFTAMLKFVNHHKLKPVIDSIRPLTDGNTALEEMASSPQFGKSVLSISE